MQISPIIKREKEKRERNLRIKESTIEEKKEEEKEKEHEEMNEPDFILICISSILGFLFKYLFDIIFSYYRKSFEDNYDKEHKSGIDDIVLDSDAFEFEKNIKIFDHDKTLFILYFLFMEALLYYLLFYTNLYLKNALMKMITMRIMKRKKQKK